MGCAGGAAGAALEVSPVEEAAGSLEETAGPEEDDGCGPLP
jgi:hypothetical protein